MLKVRPSALVRSRTAVDLPCEIETTRPWDSSSCIVRISIVALPLETSLTFSPRRVATTPTWAAGVEPGCESHAAGRGGASARRQRGRWPPRSDARSARRADRAHQHAPLPERGRQRRAAGRAGRPVECGTAPLEREGAERLARARKRANRPR